MQNLHTCLVDVAAARGAAGGAAARGAAGTLAMAAAARGASGTASCNSKVSSYQMFFRRCRIQAARQFRRGLSQGWRNGSRTNGCSRGRRHSVDRGGRSDRRRRTCETILRRAWHASNVRAQGRACASHKSQPRSAQLGGLRTYRPIALRAPLKALRQRRKRTPAADLRTICTRASVGD